MRRVEIDSRQLDSRQLTISWFFLCVLCAIFVRSVYLLSHQLRYS